MPSFNTDLVPLNRKTRYHYCAENASAAAALGGHMAALYRRLDQEARGALRRNGGADHVLLAPRVGAHPVETAPLCELDYLDERWGVPP